MKNARSQNVISVPRHQQGDNVELGLRAAQKEEGSSPSWGFPSGFPSKSNFCFPYEGLALFLTWSFFIPFTEPVNRFRACLRRRLRTGASVW